MTEDQITSVLSTLEKRLREARTVDMEIERGFDVYLHAEWPQNGTETLTFRFNGGEWIEWV